MQFVIKSTIFLSLTLLIVALGFGCSSSSVSNKEDNSDDRRNIKNATSNSRYPSWFINMPQQGAQSAVGYSTVNAYSDADFDSAYKNGVEQLSFATSIHIFGEAIYELVPGIGKIPRGDNIKHESVAIDTASIVGVDTLQDGNLTFVLLSLNELSVRKGRLEKMSLRPPTWVTELPAGSYTVGVSQHYYYEHNAWLAAEKQARLQLSFMIVTKSKNFDIGDGQRTGGASIVGTNSNLSGAQVVSRWTNGSEYYVLMSLGAGVESTEGS